MLCSIFKLRNQNIQARQRNFKNEFNKRFSLMNQPSTNGLPAYYNNRNSAAFYTNNDANTMTSNNMNNTSTTSQGTTATSNQNFYDENKNTRSKNSLGGSSGSESSTSSKSSFTPSTPSLSSASTARLANSPQSNNSEIKYVKFKNYGLHKSLGENLNKIDSPVPASSTSYLNHNAKQLKNSSSGGGGGVAGGGYISKSTINLPSSVEKNSPAVFDVARNNRLSLNKIYKNELNASRMSQGQRGANDESSGSGRATASVSSRAFHKSCSPQSGKRCSQVDFEYANPMLVKRTQNNFSRFYDDKETKSLTVEKKSSNSSMDFLNKKNDAKNARVSNKPNLVNKPIQLSSNFKFFLFFCAVLFIGYCYRTINLIYKVFFSFSRILMLSWLLFFKLKWSYDILF